MKRDDPQEDCQAYEKMDESMHYLQKIHKTVIKIHNKDPSLDSIDLCRLAISELGLPEAVASPLTAKSFQANLKIP